MKRNEAKRNEKKKKTTHCAVRVSRELIKSERDRCKLVEM